MPLTLKDYEAGSFGSHRVIPARIAGTRVPWMAKTIDQRV